MSKKAFALRLEQELFDKIEALSKKEYRSVNGQIEWMLNRYLMERTKFDL